MADIRIKRVHEPFDKADGYRILVDGLWPRGIAKDELHIDIWMKEVAPTGHLRKWFDHDPNKFTEFARRYRGELKVNPATHHLRDLIAQHPTVTLLYGAHDTQHNHAVVLMEYLR